MLEKKRYKLIINYIQWSKKASKTRYGDWWDEAWVDMCVVYEEKKYKDDKEMEKKTTQADFIVWSV